MMNFFAKLSKHKKALFFASLFLTIFLLSIIIPQITLAQGSVVGQTCQLSWMDWIKKQVADVALVVNPLTSFITGALWLWKQLAIISGVLTSMSIDQVLKWHITTVVPGDKWAQVWIDGWKSIKDIANMAIVLGFVAAGIGVALRIQDFGIKKFLPKLIMIAILINFSGLFVGLVIDAGTLITKGLGGLSSQGLTIVDHIQTAEDNIICAQTKGWTGPGGYYMVSIYFVYIYIYTALALFYLLFAIIDRYIILGFMFMLSPLAFVCAILPFSGAKKLWGTWIDTFLKQVFIGVGLSFVLFISGKMLDAYSKNPPTEIMTIIFCLSIVLSVIIVGTKLTRAKSTMVGTFLKGTVNAVVKSVVFGGQIALAVATGGASAAGMAGLKGLAMGAAGGMLNKKGTPEALNKVGRWMERMGAGSMAKKMGVGDAATQDMVSESAKRQSRSFASAKERYSVAYAKNDTAGMSNALADMDRVRKMANTGRGVDRAGAVQAIVDNKDLHNTYKDSAGKFDANAANASIDYARSVGAVGIRDKAEKLAPALAGNNIEAVDKMLKGRGITNPARATTAERESARQEVVVRVAIKTPEEELDRTFADSMNSGDFSVAIQRMKPQKQQTLIRSTRQSMVNEEQALNAVAARTAQQQEQMDELTRKIQALDNLP